ncbi:MAG: 2-C-methyl-D-erythritol 4-phosphate cytidylyltransferase [Lachnospiraceae bacterium]|nr:2-C-methyl-D-erythritol 4-phosphate cytidylyltransferase [Lachnospiraceae bacterium]MBP3577603.1 2-C-methyl-D-erythritol 4-phosphate cytidylyltransferase [Lachnospiraceae bacterium]
MAQNVTAIVLAAGKGSRMNSEIPKQYLSLLGKPVLFYSLQAFEESNVNEIILVTGSGEQEYCKREIVDKYQLRKVRHIVEGGAERYHSVYQGLLAAKAEYVLIHDGARPLVSPAVINKAIDTVKETGACVVGMPVKDTIQMVDAEGNIKSTPERKYLWMAQTPQCFLYSLALSSYNKAIDSKDDTITDDAMVVQRYGNAQITMVEGGYENIKVTTPEDIAVAECFLKMR